VPILVGLKARRRLVHPEANVGVTEMPDRNDALRLLDAWVENDGLKKHMLAVEAAVRHYAGLRGADPDVWGLAGLLHDLDWEKHPEEHPLKAVEHLRSLGYPEEVLHAILAHRSDFTGVEPETELDKVLVACDELSGLVFAACLVRPNGVDDLEPKSVVKKLKDKTFAAGVSREEVERGVALIGLERADHIRNVIDALRAAGAELGIRAEDLRR
jgi:putative nucleotidyltransferase with HDIG domain